MFSCNRRSFLTSRLPYCFLFQNGRAKSSENVHWSGAAQCVLVVVGFPPFEQKGIPQPGFFVVFGHIAQISKIFASSYCIDSQALIKDHISSSEILL